MKRIGLVWGIVLTLIMLEGTGGFAQVSRFGKQQYTNGQGEVLQYRILTPDYNTMRKYPLVVFLHGAGERGDDNEAQLKWGVDRFASDEMMARYPAIVIAPQCPAGQTWSNLSGRMDPAGIRLQENPSKPMELVHELILKMIKELPIDADRIYITGLSMGGYGTFDAIQRYPDLFAAAVPVCGGGDISKANTIVHIPMWIFHGAEDPTVKAENSFLMVEALMKAGAHPGYTQYPESGHFSWLAAYSDPLMIAWLFRQSKQNK